jgi:8-oxo-dGTP pyrophosphatase MutT (NUDIX family)
VKHKRSSVILIYNNNGELALQLRSLTEKSQPQHYPHHWDFSAAGGIDRGETHEIAAKRELKEELGIEAELVYLGEELYQDKKHTDQLFIYETIHNGPFNINPEEVERVEFFRIEEIEKMLKAREKFHPEFPFLLDKGYIKGKTK